MDDGGHSVDEPPVSRDRAVNGSYTPRPWAASERDSIRNGTSVRTPGENLSSTNIPKAFQGMLRRQPKRATLACFWSNHRESRRIWIVLEEPAEHTMRTRCRSYGKPSSHMKCQQLMIDVVCLRIPEVQRLRSYLCASLLVRSLAVEFSEILTTAHIPWLNNHRKHPTCCRPIGLTQAFEARQTAVGFFSGPGPYLHILLG